MQTYPDKTPPFNKNALPLLEVQGLALSIGQQSIFQKIDFSIHSNKKVGIIGPNGVGKTSLLRCIYGFYKQYQGHILIQGKSLQTMNTRQKATFMAVVQQGTVNDCHLMLKDFVSLGRIPHKSLWQTYHQQDDDMIHSALNKVGLTDCLQQSFQSLSGGEKQRAMIAKAMVQNPTLLIMDEPTSHLDVGYQKKLLQLVSSLGCYLLMSIHDLNLAANYCDQLLLIDREGISEFGKTEEILTEDKLKRVFDIETKIDQHPYQPGLRITYA